MTIKAGWQGRYFEDFEVGDVYRSRIGRTVTQNDNIWFTLLTNNTNQIHFNQHYAERTEVLEVRESRSRPQWGIVKFRTRGIKQDGTVVIDYTRSVMVWKRAHAPNQNAFPEPRDMRASGEASA